MSGDVGRRDVLGGAALAVAGSLAIAQAAEARAPEEGEAGRIIALAQALEAAEEHKDPAGWAAFVAEDYTELNGHFGTILKGRDTSLKLQQFAKETPHAIIGSYMSNADVQIFGDLAILCYVSMRSVSDREGRSDPACRRVTRIYARQGKDWALVHSHFSSFDYVSTY